MREAKDKALPHHDVIEVFLQRGHDKSDMFSQITSLTKIKMTIAS